jgi:hypothetical protein
VRILASLAALVLVALGAWQLGTEDDKAESEQATELVQYGRGDPAPALGETRPVRATSVSGLQTTVPDTLGYDENTAIFTLEQGGFRVRVMNRNVSSSDNADVVIQQLPRGGVTRRTGWIVTVVVGRLR